MNRQIRERRKVMEPGTGAPGTGAPGWRRKERSIMKEAFLLGGGGPGWGYSRESKWKFSAEVESFEVSGGGGPPRGQCRGG